MLPMNGWIKLHRSMLSWEWWDSDSMVKSWITILLMANAEDVRWHGIDIPAGSFVTSLKNLSERLKLTVDKTRTVLSRLKKTGEITVKTNRHYTLISINNWDRYQENPTQTTTQNPKPQNAGVERFSLDFQEEIPNQSQTKPEQIPNKSQTNPNKQEDKEVKKGIERELKEKDPHKKNFVRPTLEEIKAYCQENGLCIDAEYFFDYYNSNGWKVGGKSPMKDWRATARNWARRQVSKQSENHGNIIHEYKFRPDESGTEKLDWEQP